MFWQTAIAASLLLAGHVSAGGVADMSPMVRRDNNEELLRRYIDNIVEPIERRSHNGLASELSTKAAVDGNLSDWNTQTEAACITALTMLNGQATNPSGLAVCYNLPYVDNSTGVFKADLRLYNVSAPTGAFTNIPTQDVMVGLTYNGATVSTVNMSSLVTRSEGTSLISWPRRLGVAKRQQQNSTGTGAITLVQSYAFVGQINMDLVSKDMDSSTYERLLTPTVTLSGKDAVGATVNTTLDSNQASFVNGVFSRQAEGVTRTAVQPPIQTLVVASESPFVVPGLKILIFPIGGVITGIWAVLFIGTIVYGTIGRMQFRDQFRTRTARAAKGSLPRI
ncbi:ribosome-recycling factor protein [Rutstroemia sp. NJR-2017a WRK4]|nr:ribosome-recycling factor protein [Rutstroemia sp. NJR-2017a WRK4]